MAREGESPTQDRDRQRQRFDATKTTTADRSTIEPIDHALVEPKTGHARVSMRVTPETSDGDRVMSRAISGRANW
jgi:hypothetical protein